MRARAAPDAPDASAPKISTWPDSGVSRPEIIEMVVVLPAPFGPSKPKISPAATSNETPSTALVLPYEKRTSPTRSGGPLPSFAVIGLPPRRFPLRAGGR